MNFPAVLAAVGLAGVAAARSPAPQIQGWVAIDDVALTKDAPPTSQVKTGSK